MYNKGWPQKAMDVKDEQGWRCEACGHKHDPSAGFSLTVHHIDFNKQNDKDWNLAALCQRCHLRLSRYLDLDQLLFDYMRDGYWFARHIDRYMVEKVDNGPAIL